MLYECSDCSFTLITKEWDRPGELCPSCGSGQLKLIGELPEALD